MLTKTYNVYCTNPACNDFDKIFNEFQNSFEDEEEEMSWLESFGHGGEDKSDYCPVCDALGEIILPEDE